MSSFAIRIGVAFPSRKARLDCGSCGGPVDYPDHYCRHCGEPQPMGRLSPDADRYFDLVAPIGDGPRRAIEAVVLEAYRKALGNWEAGGLAGVRPVAGPAAMSPESEPEPMEV